MVSMKKKMECCDEKPMAAEPEEQQYPYGLCISIDKEELVKLGFKGLPKIGESFTIKAKAFVKSCSMSASDKNEYASASFQITDMELDKSKASEDGKTASMMFDKMK